MIDRAQIEWTGEDQELLTIWWAAGMKVPELARRFKRPKQFIEALTESLPPQSRQQSKARERKADGAYLGGMPPDEWSEWEDLLLMRLRGEGNTFGDIGEALRRSERSVCKRFGELRWRGKLIPEKRVCSNEGCENRVSRWNLSSECFACQEAVVGGSRPGMLQ